jgi:hypothetical protein
VLSCFRVDIFFEILLEKMCSVTENNVLVGAIKSCS